MQYSWNMRLACWRNNAPADTCCLPVAAQSNKGARQLLKWCTQVRAAIKMPADAQQHPHKSLARSISMKDKFCRAILCLRSQVSATEMPADAQDELARRGIAIVGPAAPSLVILQLLSSTIQQDTSHEHTLLSGNCCGIVVDRPATPNLMLETSYFLPSAADCRTDNTKDCAAQPTFDGCLSYCVTHLRLRGFCDAFLDTQAHFLNCYATAAGRPGSRQLSETRAPVCGARGQLAGS